MSVKISIVIPTYNRPKLLVKCLAALKNQSFSPENYEVIVVTDGPDKSTHEEVISFIILYTDLNIFCTSLTLKAGPAAARNKGAGMAKGELILFTDDDCIPHIHWLRSYWKAYCKEQSNEVAFTGNTIVPHAHMPTDYEKNITNLETAEFITANCACTKHAFEKVGGFDEDFPIAWREDSELQFKFISARIPIIKITNAVVVHPVRSAGWGVSLKEQKKSKYNALLRKKHPQLYEEKISAKPLWNYYSIVIFFSVAVISYIRDKPAICAVSTLCWLLLVCRFIFKRLRGTSKKPGHVFEMITTSMLIPFLSVFWTLYGSFRYKKVLL